ncbi:hypothetical protein XSR1_170051 [Xenorhabdus szentirmaii DSM 16338]|uniref:Uncharacterized protein n=1 Tax=Xenorhabdus szentirmaii DSM 16338 TaxID=1427518 RepID=W1IU28_9GAMM|nr:hypothetical protein XSR1_170051 [Xenorhabdus szentirmaii DSM 16338]
MFVHTITGVLRCILRNNRLNQVQVIDFMPCYINKAGMKKIISLIMLMLLAGGCALSPEKTSEIT